MTMKILVEFVKKRIVITETFECKKCNIFQEKRCEIIANIY